MVLIRALRLHESSLLMATEQRAQIKAWGNQEELLALIFEEVSTLVAHHRRDKPIKMPRPEWMKTPQEKASAGNLFAQFQSTARGVGAGAG